MTKSSQSGLRLPGDVIDIVESALLEPGDSDLLGALREHTSELAANAEWLKKQPVAEEGEPE